MYQNFINTTIYNYYNFPTFFTLFYFYNFSPGITSSPSMDPNFVNKMKNSVNILLSRIHYTLILNKRHLKTFTVDKARLRSKCQENIILHLLQWVT